MSSTDTSHKSDGQLVLLREKWLERLNELVSSVKRWAEEFDWTTRQIDKELRESELGSYRVPVLLLQKEAVRVLLEPIASSAPGADGVVDLYLVPAYDDIASLYYCDGAWRLHYMYPDAPVVADIRAADFQTLSRESLQSVLGEMIKNGG